MGRCWMVVTSVTGLLVAACNAGDQTASPTTSVPSSSSSTTAPTTTAPTSPTAAPTTINVSAGGISKAATAIIEPDTVAGIPLGATKSEVYAVLGEPTSSGRQPDVSGAEYDFLHWALAGNRGLTLSFRTPSATSPRLTDWSATAPGPATSSGIQVQDPAGKVETAYGPLEAFCCETHVASVERGGGRMIVVVGDASHQVENITGGDPAFWSRSIAD